MATKTTAVRRNAMIDNFCTAANGGFLDIYSGTQPTDADTALAGNTLLASLPLNATAAAAASAGSATFNSITSDTSADATGTATFFRMFASNHTTALQDGTVSTSGAQLNLNTVSIVAGATVAVTSFTETQAA